LPQVHCIFTAISTSLSPGGRQRGRRYAIRAGRNLPDKEFRYLRTVIVTAAVYRGFVQELAPHPLTFRHRAGVTPYTSAFALAECCVFGKQSRPPFHCNPPRLKQLVLSPTRGTPSPEVTVPFCLVPSPGFSQAPWASRPAHQCRFQVRPAITLSLEAFLGSVASASSPKKAPHHASECDLPDLPRRSSYTLGPGLPSPGWA
jgi:hypothetical protein